MKLNRITVFLFAIFSISIFSSFAPDKTADDVPENWSLLDPAKDGYEGTRTKTFYEYLETLNEKPQRSEVIVAVIDSGFDIDHPDLKNSVWKNEAEVLGVEGIDDDNNGYIDDFYGWNFLGDARYLNLEVTRELEKLNKKNVPETDPYYEEVLEAYYEEKDETESILEGITESIKDIERAEKILREGNYTTDPKKLQEIAASIPEKYSDAAGVILGIWMLFGTDKNDLIELKKEYEVKSKYLFDKTEPSSIIGDDPENLSEKGYGNNNVKTSGESHGTHVSGIIASDKFGQAPFAKLMFLKAVPEEGDERDKDIGNAIRYAADNGASVINMSAGKYFSPHPEYVVDAINYAKDKGVLFVVSAGNEGDDIENLVSYPRKFLNENGRIKYFDNMVVVGASTWMQKWNKEKDPSNLAGNYDLAAGFSNYGKNIVDLFAPGLEIYSTIPGGKYKRESGTSMASPEVTGIAAVIKAYFPEFSPMDIKNVLTRSVRTYGDLKVKTPGEGPKVKFSELSKTGGVIDLMNAWEEAVRYRQMMSN